MCLGGLRACVPHMSSIKCGQDWNLKVCVFASRTCLQGATDRHIPEDQLRAVKAQEMGEPVPPMT